MVQYVGIIVWVKNAEAGETLFFCEIVTLNGNLSVSLFSPCLETVYVSAQQF